MSSTAPATQVAPEDEGIVQRIRSNISAGNLGSWPVLIGLAIIVLFF